MKKFAIILALLVLAGCNSGNEVFCSQTGELFYRNVSGRGASEMTSTQATSIYNTKQYCSNAADGTITIKFRDQGTEN